MNIAIIGGPGNGMVAAAVAAARRMAGDDINVVGFLNDNLPRGTRIGDFEVIDRPDNWRSLPADTLFVQAILSVGKMHERRERLQQLEIPNERWANLIHPYSAISDDVVLGVGNVVCAFATIQPMVKIGDHCFIRAGANVGHDAQIADCVDLGPNTTICGYAELETGVHIAPNAVVRDRLKVGAFSTLSAGSAALKDMPLNSTWIGNPARRIK